MAFSSSLSQTVEANNRFPALLVSDVDVVAEVVAFVCSAAGCL